MAIDATGTPTSLGIPKFNTAVDAPSGKGSNAQMDAIDSLIVTDRGNIAANTAAIALKPGLAMIIALGG